jgi:hypothetical protein
MFVELVFFKSKPDVTEDQVAGSAKTIQALAQSMGKPFEIDLYKSEDGEWVEIVRWNSQEEAQQVEQAVMAMPEALNAMSVMDESSIEVNVSSASYTSSNTKTLSRSCHTETSRSRGSTIQYSRTPERSYRRNLSLRSMRAVPGDNISAIKSGGPLR